MADSQGFLYRLQDSTPEGASWSFTGEEVTALNIAGVLANGAAYETAVEGLTLGQWKRKQATIFDNSYEPAVDTTAANQKEIQWLVRYHNATTGAKFHYHIPTADLSILPIINGKRSEFVDLTAGAGLAFKNAFLAVTRCPDNDEEVPVLDSVQFVGGR